MRPLLAFVSSCVVGLSGAACAPVLTPVDEIGLAASGERALPGGMRGLAREPSTGELFAVLGAGVLRFGADGAPLPLEGFELPRTEEGGVRTAMDVAALGDGAFVVLANTDGHVWDRVTGRVEQRFCVVPGIGPSVRQENGSVAVDLAAGLIAAVPRMYETRAGFTDDSPPPRRLEQRLRTYRFGDGVLASSVDLQHIEDDIEGLAFADDGAILAVAGRSLYTLTARGEVLARAELEGVDEARGLAREGARIFVASGGSADRVLVYELDDAR